MKFYINIFNNNHLKNIFMGVTTLKVFIYKIKCKIN